LKVSNLYTVLNDSLIIKMTTKFYIFALFIYKIKYK